MSCGDDPDTKQRFEKLRDVIRSSFPSRRFDGKITPSDGEWTRELDDDQMLFEELHGRQWSEVPRDFIYSHCGGTALLTDEAFIAFLPAWLQCALEDPTGENVVREYMVYAFSPEPTAAPDMSRKRTTRRVRRMSQDQLFTVRSLMEEFANSEPSKFIRNHATNAVAFIDQILNDAARQA